MGLLGGGVGGRIRTIRQLIVRFRSLSLIKMVLEGSKILFQQTLVLRIKSDMEEIVRVRGLNLP